MLVYTKVIDGVKHLFGTLSNVPSADDEELIYKDDQADDIELVVGDSYLDNKNGGIIRKSDGSVVNVFIGDTQIIGDAPVSTLSDDDDIEETNE